MNQCKTHVSEIIEMSWYDKTSFDDIYTLIGFAQSDMIKLMRTNLKPFSFCLWSKRVSGEKAKHKNIGATA